MVVLAAWVLLVGVVLVDWNVDCSAGSLNRCRGRDVEWPLFWSERRGGAGPDAAKPATLINGYQTSQMLHVAATLRIADLLKDGPRSTADLAAAAGAHEDTLYRLMRTLASLGNFAEKQTRRFELNPAAECLRSDVQARCAYVAEILGQEWMWRPWGALLESVRTGTTAFDHLYGLGTFDWFAKHPDARRLFDAAKPRRRMHRPRCHRRLHFSKVRRVVDVGGSDGTLLTSVLRINASTTGVLFDLPGVVEAAKVAFDRSVVDTRGVRRRNLFHGCAEWCRALRDEVDSPRLERRQLPEDPRERTPAAWPLPRAY